MYSACLCCLCRGSLCTVLFCVVCVGGHCVQCFCVVSVGGYCIQCFLCCLCRGSSCTVIVFFLCGGDFLFCFEGHGVSSCCWKVSVLKMCCESVFVLWVHGFCFCFVCICFVVICFKAAVYCLQRFGAYAAAALC